jgi:hypothetical protein
MAALPCECSHCLSQRIRTTNLRMQWLLSGRVAMGVSRQPRAPA